MHLSPKNPDLHDIQCPVALSHRSTQFSGHLSRQSLPYQPISQELQRPLLSQSALEPVSSQCPLHTHCGPYQPSKQVSHTPVCLKHPSDPHFSGHFKSHESPWKPILQKLHVLVVLLQPNSLQLILGAEHSQFTPYHPGSHPFVHRPVEQSHCLTYFR